MTLSELQEFLRKSGIKQFNTVVTPVGPDNEWSEAEQIEDCCEVVPDHDPCVGDGKKVEPWNGWTDAEKQELGFVPKGPTAQELLNRYEKFYGKGNVHLKVNKVGPSPCGEKITNYVGSLGCCTSPSELVKGSGPSTVARDSTFTFNLQTGTGTPSITWNTIGQGITVAKSSEYSARGTADDCFCKPVIVYAQDSCESVAPWVVSASDGSWATISDESLDSPFGWYQDGTTGSFYVSGFNDDNTKVSTQHYFQAEYVGTKEVVCGTSMPGINTSPIVEPQESQGFEKCDSASIWLRLREGYTNVWVVRYAIDSQSTIEYTPGACEDELEYDTDGSITTILDSSNGIVRWTGGVPPYTIEVEGVEVYLDSAKTITEYYPVTRNWWKIYTGNACGGIYFTVTDSCGSSDTGAIRAVQGQWNRYLFTSLGTSAYAAFYSDEGCADAGYGSPYSVTSELLYKVDGVFAQSSQSPPGGLKKWALSADILCDEDVSNQKHPEELSGLRRFETGSVYQVTPQGKYQVYFYSPDNVTNYVMQYFEWDCAP